MSLKDVPTLGNLTTTTHGNWFISPTHVDYQTAIQNMEDYVAILKKGCVKEAVWFLEHSDIYTGGTSAKQHDILDEKIPYVITNRGGQVTYHGPGQLIAYVMIDLKRRNLDLRAYVTALENWIQTTLKKFNIKTFTDKKRVGVWVKNNEKDEKIAALGVRVSKGITWHGIAINLAPDLTKYSGIVPCGIDDAGITSFKELEINITRHELIVALKNGFEENNFLKFRG